MRERGLQCTIARLRSRTPAVPAACRGLKVRAAELSRCHPTLRIRRIAVLLQTFSNLPSWWFSLELENRKTSDVRINTRRRKFRPGKPARARNRRSGFHTRLASALPRGIFARNPLVGRYRSRGCVPLTPQVSLAQPPNSVLSGGGVKTAIVPLR